MQELITASVLAATYSISFYLNMKSKKYSPYSNNHPEITLIELIMKSIAICSAYWLGTLK
jgi:hypothetical protein